MRANPVKRHAPPAGNLSAEEQRKLSGWRRISARFSATRGEPLRNENADRVHRMDRDE